MTFSADLRAATTRTWDAATGHRFVEEIWRGEVPTPVLTTYLVQDNQFLDAFVALMGATVAAADRAQPRIVHARRLGLIAGPESDYFARSFDALDVPSIDRATPELLAPTRGFLDLMNAARRSADYPTCLTPLLVAEWLYLDCFDVRSAATGRADVDLPDEPIQREWIELHAGPEFEAWVTFLRAEFDRVTATLDNDAYARVTAEFTRAVDLELAFFEVAYNV
ncbi:MAG: TenA family protein [Pseudonocardia sp.]